MFSAKMREVVRSAKCRKARKISYFVSGGHCLFLLLTGEVILRAAASVYAGTKAALVLL